MKGAFGDAVARRAAVHSGRTRAKVFLRGVNLRVILLSGNIQVLINRFDNLDAVFFGFLQRGHLVW